MSTIISLLQIQNALRKNPYLKVPTVLKELRMYEIKRYNEKDFEQSLGEQQEIEVPKSALSSLPDFETKRDDLKDEIEEKKCEVITETKVISKSRTTRELSHLTKQDKDFMKATVENSNDVNDENDPEYSLTSLYPLVTAALSSTQQCSNNDADNTDNADADADDKEEVVVEMSPSEKKSFIPNIHTIICSDTDKSVTHGNKQKPSQKKKQFSQKQETLNYPLIDPILYILMNDPMYQMSKYASRFNMERELFQKMESESDSLYSEYGGRSRGWTKKMIDQYVKPRAAGGLSKQKGVEHFNYETVFTDKSKASILDFLCVWANIRIALWSTEKKVLLFPIHETIPSNSPIINVNSENSKIMCLSKTPNEWFNYVKEEKGDWIPSLNSGSLSSKKVGDMKAMIHRIEPSADLSSFSKEQLWNLLYILERKSELLETI